MRSLFTLAFTFFTFLISSAQIKGKVKDAEGNPLSGVTISLLKDSAVVKLSVTKEDGLYNFSEINEGSYRISASHIGYVTDSTEPFIVSVEEVRLADLQLSKASSNLTGVTVTASKPIIEVKADKMIVNVEGTINATGNDALELLRKSPGVLVDKDDNLSLSGKNGVQVYIDGRPTPLAGQDLAQYLKTMQSTEIEAIEIITNPSARYEAAGNAGIINIKLKKNKAFGTNGSVTAGFNMGVYPKYNSGVSLNHRNNKINVFGNYNFNKSKNQNKMSSYRTVLDTLFDQQAKIISETKSHNFKTGIDYFINKESTIGAIVTGNFSSIDIENNSRIPISYKPTNVIDRVLEANNRSDMKRNNSTLNLNYTYNSAKGKSLNLNADYGYYDINTDQLQPNDYYSPSGQLLNSINYQMVSPTKIHISSVKGDYEQGLGKGKLGLGGKIAYINTDNDFSRYNLLSTGRELDKDRSNHFRYNENINAAYANYNRPFTGFMIQAGVRMEHTVTDGKSTGLKFNGSDYENSVTGFKRSYVDLFPSAAITFNKNPMKQLNFTYSRRIDRPAYQDLNPFEFKLDEYTFQKGNINLRPQYTNSFGATYTYKYKLNTTLNYSHVKNMFTLLIDTAEKSKAFISKQNLATQDIVSLNVSYPFMYKTFTSFFNMSTNYSQYHADFGAGREIDLNAFALSVYSQNSFKFGKTKTWTAELTGFYNAPTIWQGAFRSKTLWSVEAGMQKQLFQGKGTIKASYSDIFNSLRFNGRTDFAGQTTRFKMRWETQQLKLNFTYRFGSAQVKAARQRATGAEEESKRTQGGGGIGINQ
jgi:iron complex outermembrane recepter protein